MAKTTITQITDDIDGSKDAREVSFAFDGTQYTIDLSKKNLAAFEKAMKSYIDAATRVPGRAKSARTSKSDSRNRDLSAIREWAKGAGIEVSERGRIAADVVKQYEAAQS